MKTKKKPNVRFYVTHYVPEPLPKEGLKKLSFMTTNSLSLGDNMVPVDKMIFFVGFGTHRSFTAKDLKPKISAKSLVLLSTPFFQIFKWQCLWVDNKGEVYIGDKKDPLTRNKNKAKKPLSTS